MLDGLLRSRVARYTGWVLGLAALAFLIRTLVRSGGEAAEWVSSVSGVPLVIGVVGFALYQAGLMVTLRLLFDRPTARIWGITQLVKYLPVPGSAAIGMIGTTVRDGGTSRQGFELLVRHTVVHVGAATLVGAPALWPLAERWLPLPPLLPIVLLAIGGLGVAVLGVKGLPVRRGGGVVVLSVLTWVVLGVLLFHSVALGVGPPVEVAAAFAIGWVAGQLAVPVPAGVGVREVVLVLLLSPHLGDVGALSFALGTRILHIASDAGVAALVLGRDGWQSLRAAVRAGGEP